jgi:tetratricopeptide (TPR) repeat protein
VREYALERLAERADGEGVRARHAEHFVALAESAEPELTAEGGWLRRLDEEDANLRAAIAWSGRAGRPDLELRLTGALARFWAVRGHLHEGRAWLDDALQRRDGQPPGLRAKALLGAATIALRQGDYQALGTFADEALSLCESSDDKRGTAQALDRLATAAANTGDPARGMELYERSVRLFRELGDERGLAVSTTNLGCLALMQGDLDQATAMSEEGLELHRRMGQRDGMLQPQFNLGVAALLQEREAKAAATFAEGLELALELGYIEGLVYFLEGFAALHVAGTESERAATLLGAAEAAAERAGVALEPFERELHERTLASARAALGEAKFAAAHAAGRELSPRQAADYARAGAGAPGSA